MNGGSYPGNVPYDASGVPVAGQVFSQVYIARSEAVDGSVSETDFRSPG